MILTDHETKVDLLNNEAIATTIIGLLRERPDRPVTIGVHGDWGAGKSSVLEMIEGGLSGKDEVLAKTKNQFDQARVDIVDHQIDQHVTY